MNPSHVRLHTTKVDGIARFRDWMARPLLEPAQECSSLNAIRLATHDMKLWKGTAVHVAEVLGWTVLNDLSGGFGATTADELLTLAREDELLLIGYNDATCSARLVSIQNGIVVKDYSHDSDLPEFCWNRGRLADEDVDPIDSWIDVAGRMDDHEIAFTADSGTLLIFAPAKSG